MCSFEVHYVVVTQKISPMEGAKYEEIHHTSAPPIHTFLKLQQHNVPQKITFFMKIYDCENNITVQSEKLEKSQFYCFYPLGIIHKRHLLIFQNF